MDKYHFIRQVTWAIENVRKRSQLAPCRFLCVKYYKRARKLILTRYKKLKDENKQACDLMLHYSEDLASGTPHERVVLGYLPDGSVSSAAEGI